MASTGTVLQVIGSTFDAQFPESDLPEIYNAINVELEQGGQKIRLVGEVAKHLGGGAVRCVALGSTDGMRRGQDCVDTGVVQNDTSVKLDDVYTHVHNIVSCAISDTLEALVVQKEWHNIVCKICVCRVSHG